MVIENRLVLSDPAKRGSRRAFRAIWREFDLKPEFMQYSLENDE